jgi:glutathione gamma-glutamylcysteinyltransferase
MELFREALKAGYMNNYFRLAEQFTTQSLPNSCGPASLIMVLNALEIDPRKKWKGIWRWFMEEVIHCTSLK